MRYFWRSEWKRNISCVRLCLIKFWNIKSFHLSEVNAFTTKLSFGLVGRENQNGLPKWLY